MLVRLPEQALNAAQPGTFDKPLFVEHPFATGGQAALGRLAWLAKQGL